MSNSERYPRLGLPKARKMAKRLQADHGINSDIEGQEPCLLETQKPFGETSRHAL